MSTALQKAFSEVDAMRAIAKASVASTDLIGVSSADGLQRANTGQAKTALDNFKGWVFVAVRYIANRISGQGINVGRVTNGASSRSKDSREIRRSLPARYKSLAENIKPQPDHEIVRLLADPNDLMTASSLLFVTVASLELTGKSFLWVSERRGRREILPIPSHWVEASSGGASITGWRVRPPGHGEPITIPASEMIYISYPSPSDPKGSVSPLMAAAGAVDADSSIETSQVSAFRNGIFPQHLIIAGTLPGHENQPHLTAQQRKQLIDPIRKMYQGAHRSGEPIILDALIKDIKRLGNLPNEMDWLDSGKMLKEKILLSFGVNAVVAGQVEGVNRASSAAADAHFCNNLNPKIQLISEALTEHLGPMFAADGERLIIWLDKCFANDAELTLKKWDLLARHAAVTENELRQHLLDLDEIEGGDLRVGEADSFAEQVSRQVGTALSQRDIFSRNGHGKVLAR